jgi:hypothetical protein
MKDPSRAHSPRPNRNINIILNNYICCIDCRIGLSTINYLVILDIHRCKITKDYRKRKATCLLLLIGNERCTRCSSPATLIFRSSHSFITLSSSALYFFSRALYNLSHLYYPLYHFRDVFLCFQILFITKALFFKCFKHDFRNTKL